MAIVHRAPAEIDAFITARHATGTVPGNIAGHLKLPVHVVTQRMTALGLAFEPGDRIPTYKVHPMWNAAPHELRHWIWQRQRDGAREALMQMGRAAA